MRNIIAFPQPKAVKPIATPKAGAKTLFVHIKRTTMIMHLASANVARTGNQRLNSNT